MFFPGYVRPLLKNFLTQEDQRILDKFMGRPEKPPSSAYSLVRYIFYVQQGLEYQTHFEFQWLPSVRFSNGVMFRTKWQPFCPKPLAIRKNAAILFRFNHSKNKPLEIQT